MASKKNQGDNGKRLHDGDMTVEEAGQMGGQKVRDLIEKGKNREGSR